MQKKIGYDCKHGTALCLNKTANESVKKLSCCIYEDRGIFLHSQQKLCAPSVYA